MFPDLEFYNIYIFSIIIIEFVYKKIQKVILINFLLLNLKNTYFLFIKYIIINIDIILNYLYQIQFIYFLTIYPIIYIIFFTIL